MLAKFRRALSLRPSDSVKFAIVFAIVNLHTLRHLSLVAYLALYGSVAIYVTVQFVRKVLRNQGAGRWTPLIVFLSVAGLGTITSLAIISPGGALYGASRFVFTIPIFFALYLYTESLATLRKHLVTFAGFFAVASLTLPLQLLTGPIPWFAESSERAGLERYSSLVGSLTALGIVGCYVVLVQSFRPSLRLIVALAIAGPAVMSLSKAAIVNVAIGVIILAILNRRAYVRLLYGAGAVVVAGFLAFGLLPEFRDRLSASLVSFGISDGSVLNYDSTVLDGAVDRLVYWPALNFAGLAEIGNPLVYVFGGGFGMADTALVPASDALAPMAHNQFAEAITVFGFLGGGLMIASMLLILVRLFLLWRASRAPQVQIVLWAYVVFLVTSVFANGTLYQPASASIFYVAMFLAVFGHLLKPEADAMQEPRSSDATGGAGAKSQRAGSSPDSLSGS